MVRSALGHAARFQRTGQRASGPADTSTWCVWWWGRQLRWEVVSADAVRWRSVTCDGLAVPRVDPAALADGATAAGYGWAALPAQEAREDAEGVRAPARAVLHTPFEPRRGWRVECTVHR